MPLRTTRSDFALVFTQRCFYLFLALLLLIVFVPLIAETAHGAITANAINLLILLAAVAAVGHSVSSFVIASLLALPTIAFQVLAFASDGVRFLAWSWMFGGAFYFTTIVYLLRYVFSREAMSADKLYGAAAAYLMIGVLWTYLYAITQHFFPGSFALGGNVVASVPILDLLYFSFTTLTTTGFGDITPVLRLPRTLAILEIVLGTLYVAILIAHLAGVYPAKSDA